jgi:oxidase EvaA
MSQKKPGHSLLFLRSALASEGVAAETPRLLQWLKEKNDETRVIVRKTRFDQLDQWLFDEKTANLRHISGNFFSIDGIRVSTNWGGVSNWEQPIINQPEIGFLGIITKEINGVLHFLMQAKIEPGNVNNVQLSPTLQATKSNYSQVHKGVKPKYLEYFMDEKKVVLLDQLQSEQGARFLRKRNRNIIIQMFEDIPVYDNFCWVTLAQIIELIKYSNIVNMDTRTVISGISFGDYEQKVVEFYTSIGQMKPDGIGARFLKSCLSTEGSVHSFDDILSWLTNLKSFFDLKVEKIPLSGIRDWTITETEISHVGQKYFKIIPVEVEISTREVKTWNQPLVEPTQEGICGFIIKEINGILHFLVQAKLECGNHDIIEMAPTVQCLTGNYKDADVLQPPFLEMFLHVNPEQVVVDTHQSEEGGRFYREQNRNMIIMVGDEFPNEVPDKFSWLTLNQLKTFLKFNNFLNIQARSLISAVHFI